MKAPIRVATLLFASAMTLQAQAAVSYAQAQVVSSSPIYHVVESSQPQQQCWEEEVVHQAPRRGESITPNLIGALIGGALGNAVGHHKSNKRVGAVVGAVIGGSIAGDISRANRQNDDYYVNTQQRCRTVYTSVQEEKLVGYDVSYRYNGALHTVRMPQDPGATVRVRIDVEPVF